ncbi:MAG: segregation/condensation protein A [Candidatus Andersenbacteria bacterium]|nr:segregation/condensation protein A [Candidatus Andersenbacteria bacterium]
MQFALPEVKIEQYEGPYDLLVELAKKEQISLSEINLKNLTDSFLQYIKEHEIDTEIIGSFLVVASTLLLIKVRQMVPSQKTEEEEEISDLQYRLSQYEKFRAIAEVLHARWNAKPLLPAHYFAEGEFQERAETGMPNITSEQIAGALQHLINRIPPAPQPSAHLVQRGRSMKDILALFQDRLATAKKLIFQDTVRGSTRQEQAVSFLAVLEMARKNSVRLEQDGAFSTLTVHKI